MFRDIELESGLNRLRYSLALYAIAFAIAWVPLIGALGSILGLISLILLIMGWRALGRSNLGGAEGYRSTSNILIATIIIGFIVLVVGLISAIVAFIGTIPPGSTPPNTTNFSAIPGFLSFIANILIVVGVGLLIVFIGQLKSALSLRDLAREISEPRVETSGNLFILCFALSAVAFVSLFAIFPELISSFFNASGAPNQGVSFAVLLSGNLIAVGLLSIAEIVLFVIACVIGYLGLNDAHSRLSYLRFSTPSNYPSPPPPPRANPAELQAARYCGACGRKLEQGSSFCSNCGTKV